MNGGALRKTYRAEDVRQGEIILKRPWQRAIFAAGLFGGFACLLMLAVLYAVSG
jgi:hypothetical protein